MSAAMRAAALKHLLMVVMGATETDGPYLSIATYHQCKTLAASTKLTAEQSAKKFQYKKKDGTTGTV
jgi:hypothetical protein